MRLFYISSGGGFSFQNNLSDEDQNILEAFQQMANTKPNFAFDKFLLKREAQSQLFRKIKAFRPDVILSFRGFSLPSPIVYKLRSQFRVPIGIWVVDDPYRLKTHEALVKPYHFVVTQDSNSVSFYRKRGKMSFHMPLASNPQKYKPVRVPPKYKSDICFIGSAFPIRVHYFDALAPLLLQHRTIIIGQWWGRLKHYDKLKHMIYNEPIPPNEVTKYYNGAKIVLNIHRTKNDRDDNPYMIPAHTPNNRTFEISACKSFQLTTWRQDLHRFYQVGQEIAAFQTLKGLKEKIKYYLNNQQEREEMAMHAYRKTLSAHTYLVRLHQLTNCLERFVLAKKQKVK
ncbi:glycosyltransferase [Hazenella sp. IB182357]|uniref:Glycosyltransferase n=1 Tax=Polycladospora coralii TaxID=2771432 RepID=A0A926N636_9BACL|nr:glycosyltransferase [Polycladospora coralii]MBD1371561.1 glycosyltransferase [Polycladospora coralii]MBS7529029.1 glycosyltransferase [Polycladospora coralii]